MKEIKRPFKVYLIHLAWIIATVFYAGDNATDLGRWTLIALAFVGAVSLISVLIKRAYFEIQENQLVINKDFFRTETIDLEKIECVHLEASPFSSPKIILKDKRRIKYMDSHAPDRDVKELLGQFNIRVE